LKECILFVAKVDSFVLTEWRIPFYENYNSDTKITSISSSNDSRLYTEQIAQFSQKDEVF